MMALKKNSWAQKPDEKNARKKDKKDMKRIVES